MQPLKNLDLIDLANYNSKRWWMWWRDNLIAVKIITRDTLSPDKEAMQCLYTLNCNSPHLHHQGWPITSNWIFNTRNWFLYILLVVKPYFDFVNIFEGVMSLILFIKCHTLFQGELEACRIRKPLLKSPMKNCINKH